jgi:hypothetical protein
VGVRRAHERHVQRVRHRHVVEEHAAAREQALVLATEDRLTEGAGDAHARRG